MKLNLRTRPLKEVRRDLLIPGVIYGKSLKSTSVEIDDKSLKEALKTYGKSMTFEVTLARKKHVVYIKHIKSNILKPHEIVHFDLHALAADETVTANIPVEFIGKEILDQNRLFVQLQLTTIECEYAPGHGIQSFEFDVSNMSLDDTVYVKDLVVSEFVKIHNPQDQMVFSIREASPEEEETEDTQATLEPLAQEETEEK